MLDSDLSIHAYHALPSVSKLRLDDLALSPLHFYRRHRNPLGPPGASPTARTTGQRNLDGNHHEIRSLN